MLPISRQLVYWAVSLLAVFAYDLCGRPLSKTEIGYSIAVDVTIAILLTGALLRDLLPPHLIEATSPSTPPWSIRGLSWCLLEGICLVGLGCIASLCQNVYYADVSDSRGEATRNFIHVTIAYIVLSELEYLRTKDTSMYMDKMRNALNSTNGCGIRPPLEANTHFSDQGIYEFLMHGLNQFLYIPPFLLIMMAVRYKVFGDIEMEIFSFLTPGQVPWSARFWFELLLLAPFRVLAEGVARALVHVVRTSMGLPYYSREPGEL